MLFLQYTILHVKAFMEVIPNAPDNSHVSHPLCLGNMKLLLERYTCSLNLCLFFFFFFFNACDNFLLILHEYLFFCFILKGCFLMDLLLYLLGKKSRQK